jgi:putative redox protein
VKIFLKSAEGDLNFTGTNERGQSIELSGNKEAVSPMESVLMAAAACSSVDIEMILKKMRQDIKSISVEVEAERADAIPAVFTKIHLHYNVTGNIKPEKVQKSLEMSMEQYCSVSTMLSKVVAITYSFEVTLPEK